MKKLVIILSLLTTISSYAAIKCGQTWNNTEGRLYMDMDRGQDIEVLVPAIASEEMKKYKNNPKPVACFTGKKISFTINKITKSVFVAIDISEQ